MFWCKIAVLRALYRCYGPQRIKLQQGRNYFKRIGGLGGLTDWRIGGLANWRIGGLGRRQNRTETKKPEKIRHLSHSHIQFPTFPTFPTFHHIHHILIRCLVRFSQIGGTDERIDFSFLSVVLSLQIISDFDWDFIFVPYIPANVTTSASAIIQPILVLI
jgi:hypothetical protein